ncbi:MAG TPA: ATP-binding protein [Terriglobales bacterium]|nr:ATP-binding protein [Terriglobales bacterium]
MGTAFQQKDSFVDRSAVRRSVRLSWEIKTLLPVVLALLNGVLLFVVATTSFADPERHAILLVAVIGALVICFVLIVTLALVIRRPMLELEDKIGRVSEGDLTATVEFARRNDELGDLGRNFNLMVRQLRESREEIERLHRTQMSRAEHLATMGEVAAGLAHEIRNPLAGIAGVMDIVGRDLPSTSPAREVLKDVREEVLRINRIVTDLLETARPKPPEFQFADLNATVEHAVIFARQQALSKAIKVHCIKSPDLPMVEHDTAQIHQVLLNLVLNAMQALDGPGTVTVTVEVRGGLAFVDVKDTGPGIPPEILPNIFRPFFTTKGHGTGLGLSLAKRIVEDHGGKLEVSSKVGHGTTFSMILPISRGNAAAAVAD